MSVCLLNAHSFIHSFPPSLAQSRFNIYIYDYCTKRGYQRTADALLSEAGLPEESIPPINAKQGLLFEYVFPPCILP